MDASNRLIARYCDDADQAAFRLFYRSQSVRLWKFLIARGCDTETAYDLVSEAFLRFFQTVCRDPRAPVALLYRIAINLRIDRYRRDQASPEDVHAAPDESRIPAAAEPDDHEYVRELIKNLPEAEQNLLLLRYWIGLSHKELAQTLALPEGTVRRHCAEVLATLRTKWKDDENRYGTG